jgi:hypothetical protein
MHKMKGFLSYILNRGFFKKLIIASYSSTLCSQAATPWFGKMFTKYHFSHLLRFFHLNHDEGVPGPRETDHNLCERYQPIKDHANRVSGNITSLIKKLVSTKAWEVPKKTSLMQYLPNKHHQRWGINFICCATLCPTIAWGLSQRGQVPGRLGQNKKKKMAKNDGKCVIGKR